MAVLYPRSTCSTISNTELSESNQALLNQLSIEEKVSLLAGLNFSSTRDIPRFSIPSLKTADSTSAVKGASFGNPLPTACFPNTTAIAATWNRDLLFEMGKAVAEQARFKAAQIVLGPTVNIHRHPRGGRNFEAFSEDPVLTGQLAAELTKGIQSTGMAVCLKHLVCNDAETARKKYSSEIDDRTLREIYLAPFQWVIREADPVMLMSAYNKVNGIYCSQTPMYKQIVQEEWGYKGSLMSDWYGMESTVESVVAGVDVEMPGPTKMRGKRLLQAVEQGLVSVNTIDERVTGVLKMVQRTAKVHSTADEQAGFVEATNTLIKQIASESIVLLKNQRQVLPLADTSKIAVIGEHAHTYVSGGGSASGTPQYYKTPLESLQLAFSDPDQLIFSPGVKIHRSIPMATPETFTKSDGTQGVEIVYYDRDLKEASREAKPVPIVFCLGHAPAGLDQEQGFSYDIITTITPKTTGLHTLAVIATGAFVLYVDDKEVLSNPEPTMTVEDFLFESHFLERRCSVPMEAGKSYVVKLKTESRKQLETDEPTPHSSKLCLLEEYSDDKSIQAAGDVAAQSDVSIVFAGRNSEWESEGSDLESCFLPQGQDDLIKTVASRSKKTVVVLFGGNPFDVSNWIDQVDAVVLAHYPGQEGGSAIADILTGKICPSGKLATSWSRCVDDVPSNENFPCTKSSSGLVVNYAEGLRLGYRHFWSSSTQTPARWDFGFGLSYTEFALTDLRITESILPDGEVLLVAEVTVQNTGAMTGAEVVQVYLEDVEASVWRPKKELKAFDKVYLQPSESKTLQISMLRKYALSFWDEKSNQWTAEKGDFLIHVGGLAAKYVLNEGFSWTGL